MPKYPHKKRKILGKQRQHLYMTIGLKGIPYSRYGLVQGTPYSTNKTVYIILHSTQQWAMGIYQCCSIGSVNM